MGRIKTNEEEKPVLFWYFVGFHCQQLTISREGATIWGEGGMVVVVVPLVGVGVGPAGEVEATDVGVRHAARPRLLHPGRGQAQLAGGMGKY